MNEFERQLKIIEEAQSKLTTGMVSEADLKEVIQVILTLIEKLKTEIDENMANNMGEMTQTDKDLMKEMSDVEKRIKEMHSKMSDKMGVDKKEMMEYCKTEMRKLQDMMPTIPSFAPLEKKIDSLTKISSVESLNNASKQAQKGDIIITKDTGDIYIYE